LPEYKIKWWDTILGDIIFSVLSGGFVSFVVLMFKTGKGIKIKASFNLNIGFNCTTGLYLKWNGLHIKPPTAWASRVANTAKIIQIDMDLLEFALRDVDNRIDFISTCCK